MDSSNRNNFFVQEKVSTEKKGDRKITPIPVGLKQKDSNISTYK